MLLRDEDIIKDGTVGSVGRKLITTRSSSASADREEASSEIWWATEHETKDERLMREYGEPLYGEGSGEGLE